jgi:uncharacterized protein YecE (DUF72 family)
MGRGEYYRTFPVVEVQQTFYKPPQVETARRWREEAPTGFEFTIKAWQLITHPPSSPTYRRAGVTIPPGREGNYGFFRPTPEVAQAWETTRAVAEALRARLILFQCPASLQPTPENIENIRGFFSRVRGSGFLMAWEPRGAWEAATVEALCRELGLIHCVDPFEGEPLWGRPLYLRLHGGRGYRHTYSDEELRRLAERFQGEEAYIMFNNITMRQDALRLMRMLEGH